MEVKGDIRFGFWLVMLIDIRTFRGDMGSGTSGVTASKILCMGQVKMKWTAKGGSRGQ